MMLYVSLWGGRARRWSTAMTLKHEVTQGSMMQTPFHKIPGCGTPRHHGTEGNSSSFKLCLVCSHSSAGFLQGFLRGLGCCTVILHGGSSLYSSACSWLVVRARVTWLDPGSLSSQSGKIFPLHQRQTCRSRCHSSRCWQSLLATETLDSTRAFMEQRQAGTWRLQQEPVVQT